MVEKNLEEKTEECEFLETCKEYKCNFCYDKDHIKCKEYKIVKFEKPLDPFSFGGCGGYIK